MDLRFGKLRAPVQLLRRELLDWRAGLSVLAGGALALAFPQPGWAGLAWIAPGLLLLAALGTSPGRGFRLGYLAGLVFNLGTLRWLLNIPFPAGAVAGWLALSAYLALYPAVWVWLVCRGAPKPLPDAPVAGADEPEAGQATTAAWKALAEATWLSRSAWALAAAITWVALEMVLAYLFSGFPWTALGVTQYRLSPLIQIAAVTSIPGVSLLVVWTSAALCVAGLRLARRLQSLPAAREPRFARPALPAPGFGGGVWVSLRFALLTDLGLPLLTLLAVTFWGARQIVNAPAPARELKLALIQPSIPQLLIWDPLETTNRFNTLLNLSEAALRTQPDLLVWPEASLPDFGADSFRSLTNLIARHRVWMVLGADDTAPRMDGGYDVFNAALLFDPAGRFATAYHKQRLVIFGEYVPLERWLPFLKRLTPIEGSFTPGEGPVTFALTAPPAKLSPLICFEDVFARGARTHVQSDTDFLLNLTNDGWFGQSSAQWQQAANAVFRAVENRRPLVRCTNNGLTCWIDAYGRLREGLGLPDGNPYAPGFLSLRLPLPEAGTPQPLTFYGRRGDVFGWSCAALAGLWAARGLGRRRVCPARS